MEGQPKVGPHFLRNSSISIFYLAGYNPLEHMNLAAAFLRLIRWPNLFFIALTQVLFYFLIILPAFHPTALETYQNRLHPNEFFLLSLSSVLIAAAGYIINDYFDLDIDRVNKPRRLVVEKHIRRRWTIFWHWILSLTGLLIGVYVSWKIRNALIVFSHISCIVLLWFYSTTFKKKLLVGNIIISLLTAWVILILYVCEFRVGVVYNPAYHHILSRLFKFAILYAGFAFIISLVREVVKDIEDMEGDARYQCRTMPVVWGVQVSKIFIATWIIVLTASLLILQVYMLQSGWWWTVLYCMALIILPLGFILQKLYHSATPQDYHRLSSLIKAVMFTGILSIIFF